MMVSPKIQELARRLLILERARDFASEGDENVGLRVIEQFRGRLVRLCGVHGYRSLISRALTLAKRENAALSQVEIGADGALVSVEGSEEAGPVLVAQLLELLTTFIGESLTFQLVRDAWPEASSPAETAPAAIDEDKS